MRAIELKVGDKLDIGYRVYEIKDICKYGSSNHSLIFSFQGTDETLVLDKMQKVKTV